MTDIGFLKPESVSSALAVAAGMKVADFGCGSGEFSKFVARGVGESGLVSAIDVRQSQLDALKVTTDLLRLKNIVFIRGNLEKEGGSKLETGGQDMVMMHDILFQSSQKDKMAAEAYRVLRSGGRVTVIDWKKGVPGFGPPEELRSSPEAVQKIFESVGFKKQGDFDASRFHFGIIFSK